MFSKRENEEVSRRKKKLFTIGHSTHSTREFIKILKAYNITMLVDVRHYPGSRFCPQFSKSRLKRNLARHRISYLHMEGLGGRRRPLKGHDENSAWRNSGFRGYADYMETMEFKKALRELMLLSHKEQLAIMCAEAVPWRCHRSLVADALLVRGYEVIDIFSVSQSKEHKLTSFAEVQGKKITYPAA